MIKFIQLIKKRPDLTRQQFMDYYEKKHAPLLVMLLPKMEIYRRNYVSVDNLLLDEASVTIFSSESPFASQADFDVITEVIFLSREDMKRNMEAYLNPTNQKVIVEDEKQFIAPKGVRRFVVAVHESPGASRVSVKPSASL